MAKTNSVVINGKVININAGSPKVADLVAQLLKACAERRIMVGTVLEHENGDSYILTRIKVREGVWRAYLINIDGGSKTAGIARNSRKVVYVQEGKEDFPGYVTELPAENDRFYDPEDTNLFLDM